MSKIKDSFEEMKRKLTNVKATTKRKIGAGILAGSLLFGGLVGCANGRVSNNETVDVNADTKVEEVQKPINIEINNQTSDENLVVVVERLVEVLREQGVSENDINELKAQISGLATKEEVDNALATMQEKLEGMISAEVNKVIDELDKNNNQGSNSGETSTNRFDVQSAMDILEQMYKDMASGASSDYLGNFKNAEKIDMQVKEALKQGTISEDDFDSVQKCIMVVQAVSMSIDVENALTHTAEQTGYFCIDEQEKAVNPTDNSISGAMHTSRLFDSNGKRAVVNQRGSGANYDTDSYGTIDNVNLRAVRDGEYYLEDKIIDVSSDGVYDVKSYLVEFIDFDSNIVDFSYNFVEGYKYNCYNEEGTLEHVGNIMMDENGGIAYSKGVSYVRDSQGEATEIHRNTTIKAISENLFNAEYERVNKEIDKIQEQQLGSENQ